MLKWMTTVPNDGLIYYTSFLNSERVILASPQAIHEVLQINAYDFVKPPFVRRALLGPLGNGLVLAEGDDHKVSGHVWWLSPKLLAALALPLINVLGRQLG